MPMTWQRLRLDVATTLPAIVWLGVMACTAEPGDPLPTITFTLTDYRAIPAFVVKADRPACDAASIACAFARPPIAAALPTGGMIVTSPAGSLHEFGASGAYAGQIGSVGRDEGEYLTAELVTADSSNRVTLFDAGTLRLLVFDSTRAFDTSLRIMPPANNAGARLSSAGMAFLVISTGDSAGQSVAASLVVPDSSGLAVRTRAEVSAPARSVYGSDLQPPQPMFGARPQWALAHDGALWYTDGMSTIITRYDSTGAATLRLATGVERQEVTAADLDTESERLLRTFSPAWQDQGKRILEDARSRAPRHHPAYSALLAGIDGTVWVRESVRPADDSVRWTAYSPRGNPLGHLRLAVDQTVLDASRSRMLVYSPRHQIGVIRWLELESPVSLLD